MGESDPLAHKPAGMTFEDAAAVSDGAILALMCLQSVSQQTEHAILVYGASGAIGTAGVQLAKHFGANVTGVWSAKNVALVQSLGVCIVIDYTREEFTKKHETADVLF